MKIDKCPKCKGTNIAPNVIMDRSEGKHKVTEHICTDCGWRDTPIDKKLKLKSDGRNTF